MNGVAFRPGALRRTGRGVSALVRCGCHPALLPALAASLVVVLAAFASSASAASARQPAAHFGGVTLRSEVDPVAVPDVLLAPRSLGASTSGNLVYHGGPVVHASAPYLIFWTPSGESIPARSQSLMRRYLTDVAADSGKASNVFGVLRQYYDRTGSPTIVRRLTPRGR